MKLLFFQLDHPNIAKILAFLSSDGTPEGINGLVLEDAAEGVLYSCKLLILLYEDIITDIKRVKDKFTNENIKQFALQLAEALMFCHDFDIIHRDVNPMK